MSYTMKVVNKSYRQTFDVINVEFVPRVGDHVNDFGYFPAPKVVQVIWEIKDQTVIIICE